MSADALCPQPRGERRLVFNSDPSTIATWSCRLRSPRRWVDLLADAGVDTLVQHC